MYRTRFLDHITAIDAADWDALTHSNQPFTKHGFLAALEASNSAAPEHGWQPHHLLLYDADTLVAAAPLYAKDHSFGEFVFDFAWANAYQRLGLNYYPKLVNAIPFTPVVGARLLARNDGYRQALAQTMAELADGHDYSSLHTLFSATDDREVLVNNTGAVLRRDCHYHWYNRDYRTFDDFLARMSSKRRKSIRRERRRMAQAGVTVDIRRPIDLTPELQATVYAFYARTYAVRGQPPYLTPEFFHELHTRLPDQVLYFIAMHRGHPVGMAFMLTDDTTLYGRHWGCADDYHSLHFETCYYAGIEYCIEQGLLRFDAGAQGEHKLRRGFEPIATYSAHIMANPQLAAAVADFVERESTLISDYHAQQLTHSSFAPTTQEP